ncbi:hypothetical protein TSOC_005240 [Tetrabaena socialis]|uniref:Uncharacterized protein n=1 Tax=Tetrabaena socialis TaxID=47790 RepID=A0A2J8A6T5_9CHLO|nr:hypothetical protein TSOC_005240 [Tetrabaena socialis]|eukprot:PNH08241.1 hypothetical protein TSOC_005240 [Tetrabaena socialis]
MVTRTGAAKTTTSTSAAELVQLLNPDRRSGDTAQSGDLSDAAMHKLLDRSHLQQAHARQQQAVAAGEDWAAGGGGAPPMPPYPLVGVGYEVVVDEPRKAVGGLQRIED